MKNKNKIILSLFLSFIIVFFNFSLLYANDDKTNEAVTTQTEQTVEVKEEPKVEAGEKVKEAVNETTSGTVSEKSYWWPWWPWPRSAGRPGSRPWPWRSA